jgi:hypothetical protein
LIVKDCQLVSEHLERALIEIYFALAEFKLLQATSGGYLETELEMGTI